MRRLLGFFIFYNLVLSHIVFAQKQLNVVGDNVSGDKISLYDKSIFINNLSINTEYKEEIQNVPSKEIDVSLKEILSILRKNNYLWSELNEIEEENTIIKDSLSQIQNLNLRYKAEISTRVEYIKKLEEIIKSNEIKNDSLLNIVHFGKTRVELAKQIGEDFSPNIIENEIGFKITRDQAIGKGYVFDSDFSNGMARVFNGQNYGFANSSGQVVIPFRFDDAGNFVNGIAPIRNDSFWYYIDKNGRKVDFLPSELNYATSFHNGFALMRNENINSYRKPGNTNSFLMSQNGDVITKFLDFKVIDDKYFIASKKEYSRYVWVGEGSKIDQLWTLFEWGKESSELPYEYDDIVKTDKYFKLLDGPNSMLVRYNSLDTVLIGYESFGDVKENIVSVGKPWGYSKKIYAYYDLGLNDWLGDFKFSWVEDFKDGKAIVADLAGYVGVIDRFDNIVIPCEFMLIERKGSGFTALYSSKQPKQKTDGSWTKPKGRVYNYDSNGNCISRKCPEFD